VDIVKTQKLKPTGIFDLYFNYICPQCHTEWTFSYKEVHIDGFGYPCGCGYVLRFDTVVKAKVSLEYPNQLMGCVITEDTNNRKNKPPKVELIDEKEYDYTQLTSTETTKKYILTNLEQAIRLLKAQGYKDWEIQNMENKSQLTNDMTITTIIKELLKNL